MKVLVTGDRNYTNGTRVYQALRRLKRSGFKILIEGEARGADTLARLAGEKLGYEVHPFPANWKEHGRAAGPIRNIEMLKQEPDLVVAFHDDLVNSKGTKHMVQIALKAEVPVKIATTDIGGLEELTEV